MMRLWFRAIALCAAASLPAGAAPPETRPIRTDAFELKEPAEAVATLTAACHKCDWSRVGHQAAVLRLEVDGHYSQHLILTRGETPAEYAVMLGPLAAGGHRLTISYDEGAWSRAPRGATSSNVVV
ncbi:MAG: hypothetical protein ABI565_05460, partial [Vicinamibacteria bacterium]